MLARCGAGIWHRSGATLQPRLCCHARGDLEGGGGAGVVLGAGAGWWSHLPRPPRSVTAGAGQSSSSAAAV